MITTSPPDAAHVVHVWHATVDASGSRDDGALARALAVLRPHERDRFARFRHEIDRRMFLAGRVMARTVVGDLLGVPSSAWPWSEGPHGRPEVALQECGVSFNLAHSAGLVVCAVSRVGPVGVDVEHRARRPLDRALVARCCASDEAADIDRHGDDWSDRFLTYWTLKESYLKAVGLGLLVRLPDVRFFLDGEPRGAFTGALAGHDRNWQFTLDAAAPAHYVAVATSVPDGTRVRIAHMPFPDSRWP